ncbi:MAG: D-2-hydroxyacid dehydrogenase [Paenibacillus dendritiformis]|uniref:D-2-hydroxyacid dehydrogenase n=1 Tax=uncultured Paenibacillus sp. TaxID=227322 RepID=UPI0025D9E464|nr:D-2-hydroxyacid dehydrogenase [uncultured Paenibacillus sp.]MDU5145124.1 D-2-hydroxyacid dehydrogenase [Paenibacillus dendritiformis]
MRIVILDGHALNPGDLSWDVLRTAVAEGLGLSAAEVHVEAHARTDREEIEARAQGAEIVLTNKTPLSAETLRKLPSLRYIGVLATGYDIVDAEAARSLGITVTNVPGYGADNVAQFVFALLLAWCHRVEAHDRSVKRGGWSRQPDFSYWLSPQTELAGRTFGIIGYGEIGRKVAVLARAFGMKVIAATRTVPESETGIRFVSRDELLAEADIVSLHCPLTEETRGMVNRAFIGKMKRTAVLINTSRGGLLHEQDVADALRAGRLCGVLLDVLAEEPPPASHPLLMPHQRLIVTPHMAWASQAARQRLLAIAADNIRAYLSGAPQHVVHR